MGTGARYAAANGVLDREDPVAGRPAFDCRKDILEGLTRDERRIGPDVPSRRFAERSGFTLIGNAHMAAK